MECCRIGRPNRSDVHLSKEEEAKVEEATRDHFDSIAPKRHTKPQRSEYSKTYADTLPCCSDVIPEYVEFQRLENHPPQVLQNFIGSVVVDWGLAFLCMQKLVYANGNQETEEFLETEYYKDLNCVDKEHHTTGTGFIAVDNIKGKSFSLEPDSATDRHDSCKGNPATNEWIPAAVDKVEFVSDKPNRSDN